MIRPFRDQTVVELCGDETPLHLRLALAMAGRLVAAMGARLVCVEPTGGDCLDILAPILPDGRSSTGTFLKTGKLLLSPSHSAETGQAVDALISGGLAAALVAEGDPLRTRLADAGVAIIEVATWPLGIDPESSRVPITEFGIMAVGGILDMIGEPDRQPLRLAGHQIAYAAGLSAFTALAAAIAQRDLDGQKFHARISLVETAIWINWKAVVGAAGGGATPSRRGDKAEFQVLPCADGWVAFVYTANQFDRVASLFGSLTIDDERFRDRARREIHVDEFMAALRPWFAQRTRDEIYAEARRSGVPLGPVYTPEELLSDAQYAAREFITGSEKSETPRFPRLPATWNGARFAEQPAHHIRLQDLAVELSW